MSAFSGKTKALLADFLDAVLTRSEITHVALKAGVAEEVLERARGNKKDAVLAIVKLVESLQPATAQEIILNLFRISVEEYHGGTRDRSRYTTLYQALLSDGHLGLEQNPGIQKGIKQPASLGGSIAAKKIARQRVLEAAVNLASTESPTAIVLFTADDLTSTGLSISQIEESLHRLAHDGLLKLEGLQPETYRVLPEGQIRVPNKSKDWDFLPEGAFKLDFC